MRVALIMVVVGDLAGSGGAERLFSHLQEFFAFESHGATVTLITAVSSLARLQAAGRLTVPARVLTLRLGETPARGKGQIAWMTVRLLWTTLVRRFEVVHICLPTPIYIPYVAALSWLPRALRPRTALTVIDCTVAPNLLSNTPQDAYERQVLAAHRQYFRWTRLDGVYSWYRAFVDVNARLRLLPRRAVVRAARFCFTDPGRFRPDAEKQNLIVFAGRLSMQKRPLLFVDAIARLRERYPRLVPGWRVEMYGKGDLEASVRERIAAHRLDDLVTLTHAVDMAPVFARSRLFVSPQARENFTSLAMLEAMAAGNAVIAQNVGQTSEFVRHGENGLLVDGDSADGFALAMADYLRKPELHVAMAERSRALATEVHSIGHFTDDIVAFWTDVASNGTAR